jgi:osmotically inducible lipoprotein OsmB
MQTSLAIQASLRKTLRPVAVTGMTTALVMGLSGCAGMSRHDTNMVVGAGVGAVAGAALAGGALATVGGAAVGAVVGREIGRK